jgi:hypothetical protein
MPTNFYSLPCELRQDIFHIAIKQNQKEHRDLLPTTIFWHPSTGLQRKKEYEMLLEDIWRVRVDWFRCWLLDLVKVDARIEDDLVGGIVAWVQEPKAGDNGYTVAALAEMGLEGLVIAVREHRI